MNYNSLFNLLYSTEISEATKAEIINKVQGSIVESCEVEPLVETYLELLDTLVYSTASESLIYNIIDETFSQLSEEAINEVSDEWVKRKVQDSMAARKNAADAANKSVKSGVVGLSQLRRQDQAQSNLQKGEEKASRIVNKVAGKVGSKPEAINKLKSAVGKVKSWASSIDKGPEYVGLSRAIGRKANQDNVGAETLRQQTTQRAEGVNKAKEKAEGTSTPSGETTEMGTSKSKEQKPTKIKTSNPDETYKKAMALGDRIHKQVQSDIKKMDKDQAKREKDSQKETEKLRAKTRKEVEAEIKAANKPAKTKEVKPAKEVKVETKEQKPAKEAKAEVKADDATKAAKKTSKKNITKTSKQPVKNAKKEVAKAITTETPAETKPAAEAPKEEPKIKIDTTKKTEAQKYEAKVKRQIAARRKDQEKMLQTYRERRQEMTAKPGYDEKAVVDLDKRIADLEKTLGKSKVNEALSELVITLLGTTISESCFTEVMEMVAASKANADKVKEKREQDVMASIDDIHKDLEAGKPIDPEKVKKAEEIMKRKEHFEELYKKKFSNIN